MSSGQQRVYYTDKERALSDDQITQQNFIGRERNEIFRALLERTYARQLQPGVSVRANGNIGTPLVGVVLDGLEMLVDSPGTVTITAGTLACWIAYPSNPIEDSGFAIVVDDGLATAGTLVIDTNPDSYPRCDVIECQPQLDSVVTTSNRDIYDESLEDFLPENIAKFFRSKLVYRVRKGTAGTPPGYSEGWLPLGLAVIQPGAGTDKVDFYDVRPLWREIGDSSSKQAWTQLHATNVRSGNFVVVNGSTTVAETTVIGTIITELDGILYGGMLTSNSPIAADDLGGFGAHDLEQLTLTATNWVRGGSFSTGASDTVILAAWIPDLGSNGIYLPRCVRYSQGVPTSPAVPNRRRPIGPNGILLAIAVGQDPWSAILNVKIQTPLTLNATGIAGCLGKAYGVPIVTMKANTAGNKILSKSIGMGDGFGISRGLPTITNRTDQVGVVQYSGITHTNATGSYESIPQTLSTFDVQAGDNCRFTVGTFLVKSTPVGGIFRVAITEVSEGISSTVNYDFPMPDENAHLSSFEITHQVGRTGVLTVDPQICGGSGISMHAEVANQVIGQWLHYCISRP